MQSSAPPRTPTKPNRPKFARSISAAADLSPPQRLQGIAKPTTAQQAAKKLHLPGGHSNDHSRKHGDKHRPGTGLSKRIPTVMLGSGSGSKSRDDAQKASIPEVAPVDIAIAPAPAPVNAPVRLVKPEDIVKERHRRGRRDEELRSTLGGLSELAHNSTRQLDNMYYSIVEKASTLRTTIASLQELAVQTVELHDNFKSEASSVESDYKQQIDHFDEFQRQQGQVETLEQRIQQGVKRTQTLSDRLEAARQRVELWEKRENEWQARTSMRLRIGWGCAGTALVLIIILIVIRQLYVGPSHYRRSSQILDARPFNKTLFMEMQADFNAGILHTVIATATASDEAIATRKSLLVFDEL